MRLILTANQIKDLINAQFNTLCIDRISGQDRLEVQFDSEDTPSLTVVFNAGDSLKSKQGIHLTNHEDLTDLSFRLTDAFEVAFRDGFKTIYIHA